LALVELRKMPQWAEIRIKIMKAPNVPFLMYLRGKRDMVRARAALFLVFWIQSNEPKI